MLFCWEPILKSTYYLPPKKKKKKKFLKSTEISLSRKKGKHLFLLFFFSDELNFYLFFKIILLPANHRKLWKVNFNESEDLKFNDDID